MGKQYLKSEARRGKVDDMLLKQIYVEKQRHDDKKVKSDVVGESDNNKIYSVCYNWPNAGGLVLSDVQKSSTENY